MGLLYKEVGQLNRTHYSRRAGIMSADFIALPKKRLIPHLRMKEESGFSDKRCGGTIFLEE